MSSLQNNPLIRKYIEHNRFGNLLEMDFNIESEGKVVYTMTIREDHLATPVTSHGGAIAALMDASLGVAALSVVCEAGKLVSTVELSIHFFIPALLGDILTVRTEILSKGNRIIVVEGRIYNQHEKLIASGNGTFNAYPKEKAGL